MGKISRREQELRHQADLLTEGIDRLKVVIENRELHRENEILREQVKSLENIILNDKGQVFEYEEKNKPAEKGAPDSWSGTTVDGLCESETGRGYYEGNRKTQAKVQEES